MSKSSVLRQKFIEAQKKKEELTVELAFLEADKEDISAKYKTVRKKMADTSGKISVAEASCNQILSELGGAILADHVVAGGSEVEAKPVKRTRRTTQRKNNNES